MISASIGPHFGPITSGSCPGSTSVSPQITEASRRNHILKESTLFLRGYSPVLFQSVLPGNVHRLLVAYTSFPLTFVVRDGHQQRIWPAHHSFRFGYNSSRVIKSRKTKCAWLKPCLTKRRNSRRIIVDKTKGAVWYS